MTAGLKVYDPSGLLLLDMTSSISQMMGYVETNSANGSAVIPLAPPGKTLFYVPAEIGVQDRGLGKRPGIVLTVGATNATLSWTYSYAGGWGFYSINCRIHYGFY